MTNNEVVIAVLKDRACLNGNEIKYFAKRLYNVDITAAAAASAVRQLIAKGLARKQTHPTTGKMVYWLTKRGMVEL